MNVAAVLQRISSRNSSWAISTDRSDRVHLKKDVSGFQFDIVVDYRDIFYLLNGQMINCYVTYGGTLYLKIVHKVPKILRNRLDRYYDGTYTYVRFMIQDFDVDLHDGNHSFLHDEALPGIVYLLSVLIRRDYRVVFSGPLNHFQGVWSILRERFDNGPYGMKTSKKTTPKTTTPKRKPKRKREEAPDYFSQLEPELLTKIAEFVRKESKKKKNKSNMVSFATASSATWKATRRNQQNVKRKRDQTNLENQKREKNKKARQLKEYRNSLSETQRIVWNRAMNVLNSKTAPQAYAPLLQALDQAMNHMHTVERTIERRKDLLPNNLQVRKKMSERWRRIIRELEGDIWASVQHIASNSSWVFSEDNKGLHLKKEVGQFEFHIVVDYSAMISLNVTSMIACYVSYRGKNYLKIAHKVPKILRPSYFPGLQNTRGTSTVAQFIAQPRDILYEEALLGIVYLIAVLLRRGYTMHEPLYGVPQGMWARFFAERFHIHDNGMRLNPRA